MATRHKTTMLTISPHNSTSLRCVVLLWSVMLLSVARAATDTNESPFGRLAGPFGSSTGGDTTTTASSSTGTQSSPLVWQPLPLRATFRPINRQQQPPSPPSPPAAPSPPTPPEALALTLSRVDSFSSDFPASSRRSFSPFSSPSNSFAANSFIPTISSLATSTSTTSTTTTTPTTTTTSTTTPRPLASSASDDNIDDVDRDELPTRQPLSRFRPTRAPSDDEDSQPPSNFLVAAPTSSSSSGNLAAGGAGSLNGSSTYRMTSECFECICEASTSCNLNSRCQTSDVRHTRCGMFLISYDQWLATGLSRELVSREALQRDPAADERAFYECVTQRECGERLLSIYLQKNSKDCDKDGRVDCYDLAAVHHSGLDRCASEDLLDSQYWADFNACFGFGR